MHVRPRGRLGSAIAGLRYGQQGLTNVEYALLIAVAAVILIAGVAFLGGKLNDRVGESGSGPGMSTLKPPTTQCDSHYSGACVPPAPPDLDCADLQALGLQLPVRVVGGDPHGLDPNGTGLGC